MPRSSVLLCAAAVSAQQISITVRNEMDEDAQLFWVNAQQQPTAVGVVAGFGGELKQQTHVGHKFRFRGVDGAGNEFTIRGDRETYSLTRSGKVRVECVVSGGKYAAGARGQLGLTVYPDWSPRGAGRFLALVRRGIFNGVAINRVKEQFLAQFGIAPVYEHRTKWRSKTMKDDPPQNIPFKAGYVAFAGSGPDSRSTEMFLVMPDAPPHQLAAFGTNPWETPFAVADDVAVKEVLPKLINDYGDMPPWGNGPDPHRIYAKGGYTYLADNFPELAYFETCRVVEKPMPAVARGADL
mmetsp:Transcript_33354/g.100569  ORF Transcript_33354/g.100569 Transcript_33354/m.100569 type:complete len:296 (+) Transcript_33354:939-1826(+)